MILEREGRPVTVIENSGNNASKRRDRHDIVAEILKTAQRGGIKTHIMYKAKLSYSQINAYLQVLVAKGFLENTTIKERRHMVTIYRTTRKGILYINNLETVNQLLG